MVIPEEDGVIPAEAGAGNGVVTRTGVGEGVGILVRPVTGVSKGVGKNCPADDGGEPGPRNGLPKKRS